VGVIEISVKIQAKTTVETGLKSTAAGRNEQAEAVQQLLVKYSRF